MPSSAAIQTQIDVDSSWATVDVYGDPDGPAIVVLPGVMADAEGWAPVAQQLEGWQTVAVIDRRGRHPSGPMTDAYDLQTGVRDAETVLREFSDVRTLFGWSYGALISLHLAHTVEIPQLIAYEPIMAPFGASALPDLKSAHADGDLDRTVEVALGQVAGMPGTVIESLRGDSAIWAGMRAVSSPLYTETQSLNDAPEPDELARKAARIDLIVGGRNRGQAPYGTTFDDVARRTPRGAVHELAGQAHLAHLEAPERLAALVDDLRVTTAGPGSASGDTRDPSIRTRTVRTCSFSRASRGSLAECSRRVPCGDPLPGRSCDRCAEVTHRHELAARRRSEQSAAARSAPARRLASPRSAAARAVGRAGSPRPGVR